MTSPTPSDSGFEVWSGPFATYDNNALTFFARFITHICAPGFNLLMGMSMALLWSSRTRRGWSRLRISLFFFVRGFALIVLDRVVNWADFAKYVRPSSWTRDGSDYKMNAKTPIYLSALIGVFEVLTELGLNMILVGCIIAPILMAIDDCTSLRARERAEDNAANTIANGTQSGVDGQDRAIRHTNGGHHHGISERPFHPTHYYGQSYPQVQNLTPSPNRDVNHVGIGFESNEGEHPEFGQLPETTLRTLPSVDVNTQDHPSMTTYGDAQSGYDHSFPHSSSYYQAADMIRRDDEYAPQGMHSGPAITSDGSAYLGKGGSQLSMTHGSDLYDRDIGLGEDVDHLRTSPSSPIRGQLYSAADLYYMDATIITLETRSCCECACLFSTNPHRGICSRFARPRSPWLAWCCRWGPTEWITLLLCLFSFAASNAYVIQHQGKDPSEPLPFPRYLGQPDKWTDYLVRIFFLPGAYVHGFIAYSVFPYIGLVLLGFGLAQLFTRKGFTIRSLRNGSFIAYLACGLGFIIIRSFGGPVGNYRGRDGDPSFVSASWLIHYFAVCKYPPSPAFALLTLSLNFLLLGLLTHFSLLFNSHTKRKDPSSRISTNPYLNAPSIPTTLDDTVSPSPALDGASAPIAFASPIPYGDTGMRIDAQGIVFGPKPPDDDTVDDLPFNPSSSSSSNHHPTMTCGLGPCICSRGCARRCLCGCCYFASRDPSCCAGFLHHIFFAIRRGLLAFGSAPLFFYVLHFLILGALSAIIHIFSTGFFLPYTLLLYIPLILLMFLLTERYSRFKQTTSPESLWRFF